MRNRVVRVSKWMSIWLGSSIFALQVCFGAGRTDFTQPERDFLSQLGLQGLVMEQEITLSDSKVALCNISDDGVSSHAHLQDLIFDIHAFLIGGEIYTTGKEGNLTPVKYEDWYVLTIKERVKTAPADLGGFTEREKLYLVNHGFPEVKLNHSVTVPVRTLSSLWVKQNGLSDCEALKGLFFKVSPTRDPLQVNLTIRRRGF